MLDRLGFYHSSKDQHMTTRLVNFKMTVVNRMYKDFARPVGPAVLEEVRNTIRGVLDIEELRIQSRKDYEDDMRDLASLYKVDIKEILDLVPSEFVTKRNTTIHDHTVEGIHLQARGAEASD